MSSCSASMFSIFRSLLCIGHGGVGQTIRLPIKSARSWSSQHEPRLPPSHPLLVPCPPTHLHKGLHLLARRLHCTDCVHRVLQVKREGGGETTGVSPAADCCHGLSTACLPALQHAAPASIIYLFASHLHAGHGEGRLLHIELLVEQLVALALVQPLLLENLPRLGRDGRGR